MQKVIFNRKQGLGVILEDNDQEENYFEGNTFRVNDEIIQPGNETTLNGYFCEPLRYCGSLKNEKNLMVFYLGNDPDTTKNCRYYSCIYWINEMRIANKFTFTSARDYNIINGKWK